MKEGNWMPGILLTCRCPFQIDGVCVASEPDLLWAFRKLPGCPRFDEIEAEDGEEDCLPYSEG